LAATLGDCLPIEQTAAQQVAAAAAAAAASALALGLGRERPAFDLGAVVGLRDNAVMALDRHSLVAPLPPLQQRSSALHVMLCFPLFASGGYFITSASH
jgi:hypothetical protein